VVDLADLINVIFMSKGCISFAGIIKSHKDDEGRRSGWMDRFKTFISCFFKLLMHRDERLPT